MSLILKEVIKNKTMWESFGPYVEKMQVPTKFYGYKNEKDKWVVKPEYEFATEFSSGIAIIATERSYDGYPFEVINEKGEVLFSMNKNKGRAEPIGKDNSLTELLFVAKVKIKNGLIVVKQRHENQNYALVNKAGQMVTDYVFKNENNITISNIATLAKQVQIAGSEVLNWGVNSLFLSEQNVTLFRENLKHYLIKKAVDNKLNNEQIKTLSKQQKALFNNIVNNKKQEVLKAPTYEGKVKKETVTLIESELEA
jgi:hypothetical protein